MEMWAVRAECTGTKGPVIDALAAKCRDLESLRGLREPFPRDAPLAQSPPHTAHSGNTVQPPEPCSCFPKKHPPTQERGTDQTNRPGPPSQQRSRAQSSLGWCSSQGPLPQLRVRVHSPYLVQLWDWM